MEMTRTGRLLILGIIFVIFGIMNPAIAKLTPLILSKFGDSLSDSGIIVGNVTVNAISSWTQFYKNAPVVLLVMVLMCSGMFTGEYQSGTLIQVVTKGLARKKILFSKMITLYGAWTVLYAAYFGVTYLYTAYYWGEERVENLVFGAFAYWLFGILIMALMLFFSTVGDNSGHVLLGVGGAFVVMIFLGYAPKLKKFLPTRLMDGLQVSVGVLETGDFIPAMITAGMIIVICGILSVISFNRRQL